MPRISLSGVRTTRTTITAGNADKVTREWLVAYTAETAVQTLKYFQGMGRFPKDKKEFLTIVDRRHGHGKEYAVRPGGRISYMNNQSTMEEVVNWIWETIRKLTYEKSGRYMRSHRVLVNGQDVRGSGASISRWSSGPLPDKYKWSSTSRNTVVQFVNDAIYARRIEQGGHTTNGRFIKPWSRHMPGGIYKKVARAAKQKFGQTVRIDFTYVKLSSKKMVSFENFPRTKRAGRKGSGRVVGKIYKEQQIYPSIKVRPRTTTPGATLQ